MAGKVASFRKTVAAKRLPPNAWLWFSEMGPRLLNVQGAVVGLLCRVDEEQDSPSFMV